VENRRVLDVEKEALLVLAHGLDGCGDTYAIQTFTSRRRDDVRIQTIKTFDERLSDVVQRRIAALRPGAYTRIGTALRHVTRQMTDRPEFPSPDATADGRQT
jgi:nitric oxide reductase NorD protein